MSDGEIQSQLRVAGDRGSGYFAGAAVEGIAAAALSTALSASLTDSSVVNAWQRRGRDWQDWCLADRRPQTCLARPFGSQRLAARGSIGLCIGRSVGWEDPVQTERVVRLFRNGRNQAVRIPRDLELPGNEALLHKEGDRLIVEPMPRKSLLDLLASWTPLAEEFPDIDADLEPLKDVNL